MTWAAAMVQTSGLWLLDHGFSYEGVDVSAQAVEEAREPGLPAGRIDDASRLPIEGGSFDVVVCVEVLEHVFARLDAVREMSRVLRPGGLLNVTVPNVAYWRPRGDMALMGRWDPVRDDRAVSEPWRDQHIRSFNAGSMRRMIVAAGRSPVVVGAHAGGVLRDVPWLSPRFRHGEPSRPYRWLESALPALFGATLHAVTRRVVTP